jgi:hypothetical protein
MKEIAFTEFKKKSVSEIKEGECLKVTGDGSPVFYVVVNPQQLMKDRVEGICSMIDASRGK